MSFSGGVRVAAVDVDNDDRADILTSPGNGIAAQVKAYDGDDLTDGTPTVLYQYTAYGTFTGGAFVGGNGGNWGETLYSWDHRNRLTAVTERDANGRTTKEVEYDYDVFDRRIAKDVDDDGDGTVDRGERYVYDGEDIALVFDGAGSLKSRYLHGPGIDELFADENALGEILWGLADNQGTLRDVVKYDAGTNTTSVVNHLKYDAFGKITEQSNAAYEPQFAYTGREWDADAGMYYYRARWYDAGVGRFASEDPIGFAAGDANLSRYVRNSPANYIDPSGLEPPSFTLPSRAFYIAMTPAQQRAYIQQREANRRKRQAHEKDQCSCETKAIGPGRRIVWFGHMWLELDIDYGKYFNDPVNVGKKVELHFSPYDHDGSGQYVQYSIKPEGSTYYPTTVLNTINFDVTVEDNQLLIQLWKDLELLRQNGQAPSYTVIVNCMTPSIQFATFGSGKGTVTPSMRSNGPSLQDINRMYGLDPGEGVWAWWAYPGF